MAIMRKVRVAGESRRGAGTHHFLGVTRGTGVEGVAEPRNLLAEAQGGVGEQ